MNSNLIDLTKFMPHKQVSINCEAAKQYFIREVLPYVCMDSLQRLIIANTSDNPQLIRLEMMRLFVESQLMRPTTTDTNNLEQFFSQ